MKCKTSILLSSVLVAFLLSGCALPVFMYARAKERRALATFGPVTDYVIEPAPKCLTDDLAVAKARETLAKEGYKTNQWYFTSMIQIRLGASSDSPGRAVFDSTRFGSAAARSVAIRFAERKETSKAGRAVRNHSRASARAEPH